MNREVHVPFCERLGVRFPRPTHRTEVGAEAVAIVQSLLTTCRLQHVDPYTYLVDVLQRVQIHPAKRVRELTPRLWKQHFADHPLRSDVERVTAEAAAPPPDPSPPTTPQPSG